MHLCSDQIVVLVNPRASWTYGEEDLIGQLIVIAQGVHPATLAVAVMYTWVICVFDELLVVIVDDSLDGIS